MAGDPASGDELRDAPPFSTWRRLYAVVVAALAVEILLLGLVTWVFG